jgi:hypothetical protein
VATRNAASLFTGAGPGATVAFSASAPSRMKSLRHRRTVPSRTPNASAMRGLVQPASAALRGRGLLRHDRTSLLGLPGRRVGRRSLKAVIGLSSFAPANRCR